MWISLKPILTLLRLYMKLKDKKTIFKGDNISNEVLLQQRKTVLEVLNYTDLKNLGLLQKK